MTHKQRLHSETNKVHLLVPIVGGEEISRVNTRQATVELKAFFDDGALSELNKYKSALAFDISHLEAGTSRRIAKEERLSQIEVYIKAVSAMKYSYNDAMRAFQASLSTIRDERAKYVKHQNAICVNFAEIIDPTAASTNSAYFESVRADFAVHPAEIPHKNESITGEQVAVPVKHLLELRDEQIDLLPTLVKDVCCLANPAFQARLFLNYAAKATPDKRDPTLIKTEAEALLKAATRADRQALLRTPGVFTDYSGRTFNCTAFEYAYWAKDIHMCRMLVSYMNNETKIELLARINVIEGIDTAPGQLEGLSYQQAGISHRSPHFDLTPLKTALQSYIDGFDAWYEVNNWAAIYKAWLAVGKAQRELPVHVVNEYCRRDRSFYPTPLFSDGAPPRDLIFINVIADDTAVLFPLSASNPGLGFNFALCRAQPPGTTMMLGNRYALGDRYARGGAETVRIDLSAVELLDKVRTDELTLLRVDLNPPASTKSTCMVM